MTALEAASGSQPGFAAAPVAMTVRTGPAAWTVAFSTTYANAGPAAS